MTKSGPGALARAARQPLLHFLLIGGVIGALYGWRGERVPVRAEAGGETIRVTAAEVERMQAEWLARWNRPPTEAELDGLVQARTREAVLYREALAMGLDEGDPILRRVLVQKLEGMVRDLAELSLSPSDQALEEYFAQQGERYRPPALITFTHVFIDPDRRGDETLAGAAEVLAELQSLGRPTEGIEEYGDAFMLQRYYPEQPEQRIAMQFGARFAESVFALEPGRWHGPVLSGYGTHLVYVDELREFPAPDLAEVRDLVVRDWVDEKRREITEQYYEGVRAKYDVIVEPEADQAP